jgi:hypothetical protein
VRAEKKAGAGRRKSRPSLAGTSWFPDDDDSGETGERGVTNVEKETEGRGAKSKAKAKPKLNKPPGPLFSPKPDHDSDVWYFAYGATFSMIRRNSAPARSGGPSPAACLVTDSPLTSEGPKGPPKPTSSATSQKRSGASLICVTPRRCGRWMLTKASTAATTSTSRSR